MKKLLLITGLIILILLALWLGRVLIGGYFLERHTENLQVSQEVVVKNSNFNMMDFLLEKKAETAFNSRTKVIEELEHSLIGRPPRKLFEFISFNYILGTLGNGDYEKCLQQLDTLSSLHSPNFILVKLFNEVIKENYLNNYMLEFPDRINRIKGLVYLRWAEDENCMNYSDSEQRPICVFPLSQFTKTSKLRYAIENFNVSL